MLSTSKFIRNIGIQCKRRTRPLVSIRVVRARRKLSLVRRNLKPTRFSGWVVHKGFFCIVQAVETVEHAIINRNTIPSHEHSPSFVFPGINCLLDQEFFQFSQTEIAVFPVNVFVIHFIYAMIIKFESFMLTRVCVICTIF